ncbi:MAG TPA: hypothetical protein VLX61_11405 [Anaerolineales bacterium]|nr:hypothetical protein [Anaerolineales bacterium]
MYFPPTEIPITGCQKGGLEGVVVVVGRKMVGVGEAVSAAVGLIESVGLDATDGRKLGVALAIAVARGV